MCGGEQPRRIDLLGGGVVQRAIHSVETQVWALKLALDRN